MGPLTFESTETGSDNQSRFSRYSKRAGVLVVITVLVFLVVEGSASTVIAVYSSVRGPVEPRAGQYDSLLGWVNIPGLDLPDRWGPEQEVHTEAFGFRSTDDVSAEVSPGRIRLLCSGDSFAFGVGVGDEETWCHLLTRRNEILETVNLGGPGYGIDQAYLRYARDGLLFDHTIHLFTFIGSDIYRIGQASAYGYGKPTFRIEADSLVLDNVPVPRLLPAAARLVRRLSVRLRSVQFISRAARRLGLSAVPAATVSHGELGRTAPVAARIFRKVQHLAEENGRLAVFVYLPSVFEVDRDGKWRGWTHAVMDSLGLRCIDLTPALRQVGPDEAARFFIPPEDPGAGHYSAEGNVWVATTLYDKLCGLPAVARKFAEPRDESDERQPPRSEPPESRCPS